MSIQSLGHSLILVKGHSDFKVKCLTFGLYTQVSDSGPQGPLVSYDVTVITPPPPAIFVTVDATHRLNEISLPLARMPRPFRTCNIIDDDRVNSAFSYCYNDYFRVINLRFKGSYDIRYSQDQVSIKPCTEMKK